MARSWAAVRGKGRPLRKRPHQVPVNLVADPDGVPLDGSLAHHQDHLEAKQLVEGQAPAGELAVGQGVRGVDLVQGPVPARQLQAAAPRLRAADPRRCGPGAGPPTPSRRSPSCSRPAFSDCGYTGTIRPVRSPTRSTTGFVIRGRPRKRSTLPNTTTWVPSLSCLVPPGLVEERDRQVARPVEEHHFDQGSPLPGAPDRAAPDRPEHHGFLPVDQVGDIGLVGPVDVAPRVVGDQVQHGVDADGVEGLAVPGPDPVEPVDPDLRQPGQRRGGPLVHSIEKR